jgi:hypothetical protein
MDDSLRDFFSFRTEHVRSQNVHARYQTHLGETKWTGYPERGRERSDILANSWSRTCCQQSARMMWGFYSSLGLLCMSALTPLHCMRRLPTRCDASPYPPMTPQCLGRPMCGATMESSEVLSKLESDSAFAFLHMLLSAKSRRAMEASDPL